MLEISLCLLFSWYLFRLGDLHEKRESHLERPSYTAGKDLSLAKPWIQQDPSSHTAFPLARADGVNTTVADTPKDASGSISSVLSGKRWVSAKERKKAKLNFFGWFKNDHQFFFSTNAFLIFLALYDVWHLSRYPCPYLHSTFMSKTSHVECLNS